MKHFIDTQRAVRAARALTACMALMLTGCTESRLQPGYSKASLQTVVATRGSDSTLAIRFHAPPESMYYAAGISYEVQGGVMRIAIDRCPVNGRCQTMLRRNIEPGPWAEVEQHVPLLAPNVVIVFADGEQQIYP